MRDTKSSASTCAWAVGVSVVWRSTGRRMRDQLYVCAPTLAGVHACAEERVRRAGPGATLVGVDDVYRVSSELRAGAMVGRETLEAGHRTAILRELRTGPASRRRILETGYCFVTVAYAVRLADGSSHGILADLLETGRGGRAAIRARAVRRASTAAFRREVIAGNRLGETVPALKVLAVRVVAPVSRATVREGRFLAEIAGPGARARPLTDDEIRRSLAAAKAAGRR